ncbi:MarR family winged helix-turn-helix transcriptional regulator [Paenibacillus humicola]|uniref:MarR family winged helix-turn-helix transcriptional regulator n=1 Tax=Paenibacillus humicola TaxID=3110540 RepID=UPI00237B5532|nr:MarR family winged helix-turn-helix transcriptional regulator [Paenibacillus humicola]
MNPDNELHKNIVLNIFRASNLLERMGRKMTAQVGLSSMQQWFILGALLREGDQSLKDLRRNTLVTKQNMTGMIERLKQGGHVVTVDDPNDRRITRVSLTGKGRETLARLHEISASSNLGLFEGFSDTQLTSLDGQIEQLVRLLNEKLDE